MELATENDKARKVAELQLYCMTHKIPFSKNASRLELLKVVKEWKRNKAIKTKNGKPEKRKSWADVSDSPRSQTSGDGCLSPVGFNERKEDVERVRELPSTLPSVRVGIYVPEVRVIDKKRECSVVCTNLAIEGHVKDMSYTCSLFQEGDEKCLIKHDLKFDEASDGDEQKRENNQNNSSSAPSRQNVQAEDLIFSRLSLGKTYVIKFSGKYDEHSFSCKALESSKLNLPQDNPGQIVRSDGSISVSCPSMAPLVAENMHGVSVKRKEIKVGWDNPVCTGGQKILKYIVQMKTQKNEIVEIYSGASRRAEAKKLTAGTKYHFRVKAFNDVGESEWSSWVDICTSANVPSAPSMPRCNIAAGGHMSRSSTELYLTWDVPEKNNGAEIQGYKVEIAKNLDDDTEIDCIEDSLFQIAYNEQYDDTNSCRIKKLTPASTVYVRVAAYNMVGLSAFSPIAKLSTIGCAPSPPSRPKAQQKPSNSNTTADVTVEDAGAESLDVLITWMKPKELNGSPVVRYTVEVCEMVSYKSSPAGTTRRKNSRQRKGSSEGNLSKNTEVLYSGIDTKCVGICDAHSIFRPGKTYKVHVLAMNDYGWSDPSEGLIVTMNSTAPEPPSSPPKALLSANKYNLDIKWNPVKAPRLNGGKLLAYVVYMRKQQSSHSAGPVSICNTCDGKSQNDNLYEKCVQLFDPKMETEMDAEEYSRVISDEYDMRFKVGEQCEAKYSEDGFYYVCFVLQRKRIAVTTVHEQVESDDNKGLVQYKVRFSGYGNIEWVAECDMRERLTVGTKCKALSYQTGKLHNALITAIYAEGYFCKFPAQALPIQKTKSQDIEYCSMMEDGDSQDQIDLSSEQLSENVNNEEGISEGGESAMATLSYEWSQVYRGLRTSLSFPCCGKKSYLAPGKKYEIYTAIETGAGFSSPSEVTVFTTPSAAPCVTPAPVVLKADKCAITMKLFYPENCNGAKLEGFKVSFAQCELIQTKCKSSSDDQIKPLERARACEAYRTLSTMTCKNNPTGFDIVTFDVAKTGLLYAFRVQARNKVGYGPWSKAVAVMTDITTPDVTRDTNVELNHKDPSSSVIMSWKEPEWHGGSEICAYRVELNTENPHQSYTDVASSSKKSKRKDSKNTLKEKISSEESLPKQTHYLEDSATRQFTFEDLKPGTIIHCRVQAVNAVGNGPYCAFVSTRLDPTTPGHIHKFTQGECTATSIKCAWKPPRDDGGSSIVGYEVHLEKALKNPSNEEEDKTQWLLPPADLDSSHTYKYTPLPQFTSKSIPKSSTYFIRVRAINTKGTGEFCEWQRVHTSSKDEGLIVLTPPVLSVVRVDPLEFSWTPCSTLKDDEVSYILEAKVGHNSKKFVQLYHGHELSHTVTKPKPSEVYRVRIRSVASRKGFGNSPFSAVIIAKTPQREKIDLEKETTVPSSLKTRKNKSKLKVTSKVEEKEKKAKVVKATEAIRWRSLPWYRRHPFISAAMLSIIVYYLIQFAIVVWYA